MFFEYSHRVSANRDCLTGRPSNWLNGDLLDMYGKFFTHDWQTKAVNGYESLGEVVLQKLLTGTDYHPVMIHSCSAPIVRELSNVVK